MPTSDQHIFKVIDDTTLPYIRNVNPATHSQRPYLVGGTNTVVQIGAPLRRRPGFDPFFNSYGSNEKSRRFFGWNNIAGTHFSMVNVINTVAGTSKIYNSTTLIFTDSTSAQPFDFVVANNHLFFGNGVVQGKWDGTTVTNWGISPQPTTAPTIVNTAAGNVPGAIGHTWVYAYGVAATGYISDISSISAPSSAANRQWTISGPRSTDAQCDLVHIYRTEDGGATYLELSNSPIANPGAGNFSIVDNDADASLSDTAAPTRGVNQPPPLLRALKFWQGRIWGINADRQYFSGFEEVNNGLPVESFGTIITNSFSYGEALTAQGVLGDIDSSLLLVMSAGTVFVVSGDTRATFKRNTAASNRGCRNHGTIVESQFDSRNPITGVDTTISFVSWLDSSGSVVMMTKNLGVREISKDIQSDLDGIDHSLATMASFESVLRRWLILCDSGTGHLRVFDLEAGIWNTPWPIATVTAVGVVEFTLGDPIILLGFGTKVLSNSETASEDDSVPYTCSIRTCLLSILDPQRPEQIGVLEYIGIERNAIDVGSVKYLLEEDPLTGSPSYTTIPNTAIPPFLRNTTATNLVEKWYYLSDKAGTRRVSIEINWGSGVNNHPKLFTMTLTGTRVGDS